MRDSAPSIREYCSCSCPHAFICFYSSVTVHCTKEKGGKADRKPCLLPYGLRNPYRNLKSEISQYSMPVSLTPARWCTLNCEYIREFSK
jgi:hypothetical protein